jgi:hypothetical protein
MDHAEEPDTAGDLSIFEKTCGYCGARFRVLASRRGDSDADQEYGCPECGKSYRTEALTEPEVRLLRPRSDGKNDRYQETMF